MEEAARDKILGSIAVGGNGFECVVHVERSHLDDAERYNVIFNLNGTKITVEHVEPGWKHRGAAEIMSDIKDAVADKIAAAVLSRAFDAVLPRLPRFNRGMGFR